mgnify:CR=1 FL=1
MVDPEEKVVKVQRKKAGVDVYYITLPKDFAKELSIRVGDYLHTRIIEVEVDGRRVRGIFYYKP